MALVADVVVLWCVLLDQHIYVSKWVERIGNESYELYLLHIFVVRVLENNIYTLFRKKHYFICDYSAGNCGDYSFVFDHNEKFSKYVERL